MFRGRWPDFRCSLLIFVASIKKISEEKTDGQWTEKYVVKSSETYKIRNFELLLKTIKNQGYISTHNLLAVLINKLKTFVSESLIPYLSSSFNIAYNHIVFVLPIQDKTICFCNSIFRVRYLNSIKKDPFCLSNCNVPGQLIVFVNNKFLQQN